MCEFGYAPIGLWYILLKYLDGNKYLLVTKNITKSTLFR
jgi:hypothetical protein